MSEIKSIFGVTSLQTSINSLIDDQGTIAQSQGFYCIILRCMINQFYQTGANDSYTALASYQPDFNKISKQTVQSSRCVVEEGQRNRQN